MNLKSTEYGSSYMLETGGWKLKVGDVIVGFQLRSSTLSKNKVNCRKEMDSVIRKVPLLNKTGIIVSNASIRSPG